MKALHEAAPFHLAGIDRAFASRLTAKDADAVAVAMQRILDGLDLDEGLS